jgi:hypothetical protein
VESAGFDKEGLLEFLTTTPPQQRYGKQEQRAGYGEEQ